MLHNDYYSIKSSYSLVTTAVDVLAQGKIPKPDLLMLTTAISE